MTEYSLDHKKKRLKKSLGGKKQTPKQQQTNQNKTAQHLELKANFHLLYHQDLKVLYQSLCWTRTEHSGWNSYMR